MVLIVVNLILDFLRRLLSTRLDGLDGGDLEVFRLCSPCADGATDVLAVEAAAPLDSSLLQAQLEAVFHGVSID